MVPIKLEDNLYSYIDPLSLEVWICFLICIPIYIGFMMSMNYLYSGFNEWEASASSVIRAALSECKTTLPPKHLYQAILVLVWTLMMVVLLSGYHGNLLAMITKPGIDAPFTNFNEMASQTQIKWCISKYSLFNSYARSKSPGTTLKTISDQAISCQRDYSKKIAVIVDRLQADLDINSNYKNTGTCKYYLTQDEVLSSDSVLALQVSMSQTRFAIHC